MDSSLAHLIPALQPPDAASEEVLGGSLAVQLELEFGDRSEAVWLLDTDVPRIVWANRVALSLWRAESIAELQRRDFNADMSVSVQERIRGLRQRVRNAGRLIERWTFYPGELPITLDCWITLRRDERGRELVLAQAIPAEVVDPTGLRDQETLRHSGVLISSYDAQGTLLLRNPAATQVFFPGDNHIGSHFAAAEQGLALFDEALKSGEARADLRAPTLLGNRAHRVIARRGRDPRTGLAMVVVTEIDVEDITASNASLQASQWLYRLLNEIVLELGQSSAFQLGQLDGVIRLLESRVMAAMGSGRIFVALPSTLEEEAGTESEPAGRVLPAHLVPALGDCLRAERVAHLDASSGDPWPASALRRVGSQPLLACGIWVGPSLAGLLLLDLPRSVAPIEALEDFTAGLADQLSSVFVSRHRRQLQHALDDSRGAPGIGTPGRALAAVELGSSLRLRRLDDELARDLGHAISQWLDRPFVELVAEPDRSHTLGELSRLRGQAPGALTWSTRLVDAGGRPCNYEVTGRWNLSNEESGEGITLLLRPHDTDATSEVIDTRFEAAYDPLTRALNRHETELRLRSLLESTDTLSVLYFNIDDFRVLNTLGGLSFGDRVLARVGALLRELSRPQDLIGRMGADEFLVAMPEVSLSEAAQFAGQAQAALVEHSRELLGSLPGVGAGRQISVSIGITCPADHIDGGTALIGAAFGACIEARALGHGQISVFDPTASGDPSGAGMLPKVSQALRESGFELYVEPVVTVTDGARGLAKRQEVLLRMRDTDGSILSPGRFLPAAERHGLMPEIDRWVVAELARQLNAYPALESVVERWHVNVSVRTLSDPLFARYVREQFVIPSGEGLRRLCFEITESAAIENPAGVAEAIRDLRQAGAEFAIDDFGVGQATYDYLRRLDVDHLKIDGSFVRRIIDSQVDRAIVRSIVEVSHAMNLETIAEFVEGGEIERIAIELGVDFLQGYGLARPAPILSLLALLPIDPADPSRAID